MAKRLVLARELAGRLEDLTPVLTSIGAYLAARSQAAFKEKRYGGVMWPTRYPGQPEPFLNVAAALRDLNQGVPVKARRLNREPVLRDTGILFRSINWRLSGPRSVEAGVFGPANAYAVLHHKGGVSRLPILPVARETLAKQLGRLGKPKKTEEATRKASGMTAALGKLGFVLERVGQGHLVGGEDVRPFARRELVTRVHRRPFVGITVQIRNEIPKIIESYLVEGEGGAGGSVGSA